MPCPDCGRPNDALTDANAGGATPKPGDITICIQCAHFGIINPDMTIRSMTTEELDALPRDTALLLQWNRRAIRAGRI